MAVAFFEKHKKCMCDLTGPTGGKEKDPPMHQLLYRLLERPISRVVFYRDMLAKLADCYPNFVNEHGVIMAARDKWDNFWAYIMEQRKQAEATRLYWDNTAIKISVSFFTTCDYKLQLKCQFCYQFFITAHDATFRIIEHI